MGTNIVAGLLLAIVCVCASSCGSGDRANAPASGDTISQLTKVPDLQRASTRPQNRVADATQPSTAPAATPKVVDAKAVAELVAMFGDKSFKVRQDATVRLIAMGYRIRPLLKTKLAENGLDVEAAARIRSVLDEVWKREATDKGTGITVRITHDDGHLLQAFRGGENIWTSNTALRDTSVRIVGSRVIFIPGDFSCQFVFDLVTGEWLEYTGCP